MNTKCKERMRLQFDCRQSPEDYHGVFDCIRPFTWRIRNLWHTSKSESLGMAWSLGHMERCTVLSKILLVLVNLW